MATNHDPAVIRAHARAGMGLSRELQQERATESDPPRGGSHGYDIHKREWMLPQAAEGQPIRASMRSLYRWGERLHRYRMTGN